MGYIEGIESGISSVQGQLHACYIIILALKTFVVVVVCLFVQLKTYLSEMSQNENEYRMMGFMGSIKK